MNSDKNHLLIAVLEHYLRRKVADEIQDYCGDVRK